MVVGQRKETRVTVKVMDSCNHRYCDEERGE